VHRPWPWLSPHIDPDSPSAYSAGLAATPKASLTVGKSLFCSKLMVDCESRPYVGRSRCIASNVRCPGRQATSHPTVYVPDRERNVIRTAQGRWISDECHSLSAGATRAGAASAEIAGSADPPDGPPLPPGRRPPPGPPMPSARPSGCYVRNDEIPSSRFIPAQDEFMPAWARRNHSSSPRGSWFWRTHIDRFFS
jgi:hypothetical protein